MRNLFGTPRICEFFVGVSSGFKDSYVKMLTTQGGVITRLKEEHLVKEVVLVMHKRFANQMEVDVL